MKRPLYPYRGAQLSVPELAALAGCSRQAMYYRIVRRHLSPDDAVAIGGNLLQAPPRRAARPARKPAGPVLDRRAVADAASAVPAPSICRAAPPDKRWHVEQAPAVFGDLRPGQYLPSETHLARVYGGRA